MTHKKYRKMLMSIGFQRDAANVVSRIRIWNGDGRELTKEELLYGFKEAMEINGYKSANLIRGIKHESEA